MWRTRSLLGLMAAVVSMGLMVSVRAQPRGFPAMANKTGWWIKIRTDRTEATSINFQVGTRSEDREPWCVWRSSDATEFDVPDKYLQVARIYIDATANPRGKKAWFCLMYKDHGVKHFDTDDRQQEDHSQTDSDGDCN